MTVANGIYSRLTVTVPVENEPRDALAPSLGRNTPTPLASPENNHVIIEMPARGSTAPPNSPAANVNVAVAAARVLGDQKNSNIG